MKIVGIDFGHGETSAGYVDTDTICGNEIQMSDLNITGKKNIIPSIICKTRDGEFIIDPSASQLGAAENVGICFKAPLIGNDRYEQITDENKVFFQNFLSEVYKSIVGNNYNPLHISVDGTKDFEIYIACPSGWDDNQIEAYKEFVRDECNIPLIDIVKESRAAYICARRMVLGTVLDKDNVLVIDFGSSTVDFTYFNNESKSEPVHEGYPYGASQVERDVLDYLIDENPEANNNVNFAIERLGKTRAMNSLLFELRKQKEAFFSQDRPDYFNPSIHLRELLLDRNLTGLYIEPKEEQGISKEKLTQQILKTYIDSLSEMLDDFSNKEGVTSIDKVVLTGGASRMFFFKDLVCEKYNVSWEEQSLVIDLNPSLTISRGIAAFGCMNERAKPIEGELHETISDWLSNEMPQFLKQTIERCTGDMYYLEFSKITSQYARGSIIKDGKHNLDGLEDKIIELLGCWVTDSEEMSNKINNAIKDNIMISIGQKIKDLAALWHFDTNNFDFSVNLNLNIQASLTSEACQNLILFMWTKLKEFIDNRDFWGFDDSTSPFKDRDSDDRNSIKENLDENFRLFFNELDYMDSLDQEISEISSSILNKTKEFLDITKLQQYC